MKKCMMFLCVAICLCGCRAQGDYETVSDDIVSPVMAEPMEICLELPSEIAAQAMDADGTCYFGEGYHIWINTVSAGDLRKTFKESTGFDVNRLDVIELRQDPYTRYEAAWTCLGEQGDQVGRIVVLDDGQYHYVMTALADADSSSELQSILQPAFSSFRLVAPGMQVNSGS